MSSPALESVTTRCGMPVLRQLPRGQPRALEQRPRLGHPDLADAPRGERRAHDAERRPDAGRRERARVAVRDESRCSANSAAPCSAMSRQSPPPRAPRSPARSSSARSGPASRHPVERPVEVDRGRPRARSRAIASPNASRRGERGPVRRRDPDRRRAAHRERLDRLGDLLDLRAAQPALLVGKRALVEDRQERRRRSAAAGPSPPTLPMLAECSTSTELNVPTVSSRRSPRCCRTGSPTPSRGRSSRCRRAGWSGG